MKNKKKTGLRIIRLLIILVFIVGTGIIAVYPFKNRDLTVEIVSDKGKIVIEKSSKEISAGEKFIFNFGQMTQLKIKEINIFGYFKSMYIKKIMTGDLMGYVEDTSLGNIQYLEDGVEFTGENGIKIIMNDAFSKVVKKQSASFLMERILMIELLFVACAIALMICKVIEEKAIEGNKSNHGPIYEVKKFVGDINQYGQYMIYAAQTDLKAEVANSYLNRLWWILEPFFNMLVYVIVFGRVMGRSVENYATFIFCALLMWNFFSKTLNYSVKLVRNNRDIVTKVYVPKFILLLSNMFLNLFKLIFSLIVLVPMMILFRVNVGINFFWVVPAYVVMMLIAFGLGMIFLHFGVYVDDLSYAVGILLNMLMFLSGVFYEVMTTLPEPLNTLMMCLNPVAMFIDTMRNALLNNTATNLPVLGIWFMISIILCCVGVHIVYKNENGYVKVV